MTDTRITPPGGRLGLTGHEPKVEPTYPWTGKPWATQAAAANGGLQGQGYIVHAVMMANRTRLLEADFTPEQCRDVTVRKEILWESETATNQEVTAKEVEFILKLRSNDPAVGYNRRPKFRPLVEGT